MLPDIKVAVTLFLAIPSPAAPLVADRASVKVAEISGDEADAFEEFIVYCFP